MTAHSRLTRLLDADIPRELGEKRMAAILAKEPSLSVYNGMKESASPLHIAIRRKVDWALPILLEKVSPAEKGQALAELMDFSIRAGNVSAGRLLCAQGARPGRDALASALTAPTHCVPDVLDWLMEEGADLSTHPSEPIRPYLQLAIIHHREYCLEVVQALLARGLTLEGQTSPDGETPLHAAAAFGGISAQLWKVLMEAGASVHAQDEDGRSALDLLRHFPQGAFPSDAKGVRSHIESIIAEHGLSGALEPASQEAPRLRL